MPKLVGMTTEKEVGAFEAKTRLAELLDRVRETGAVYIITKRGVPVAELRPIAASRGGLRFGCDAGQIRISKDFDTPIAGFEDYSK